MSVGKLRLRADLAGKFGGSRTGKRILGSVAGVLGLAGTAHANDLYWTGAQSQSWNSSTTVLNWQFSNGSSSYWTNGNTDVAHFSGAVSRTTVTLSGGIKGDAISFESLPASYTLTSNSFNGVSGGNITLQSNASSGSTGTGAVETINSAVNITGTSSSSYAFNNSDPYAGSYLIFGGAIGGTNTAAGSQATLSLNGNGTGTNTISGVISNGTGIKLGITINSSATTSIWKFTNSNTYTGITSLSGGSLIVANTTGSATGTGTVNVTGGTLASGIAGAISGTVNATTGTDIIAPGTVGGIGTLTLNGALSTGTNSTLAFDLGAGPAVSGIISNGDLLNLNTAPTIASGTPLSFGGTPVKGDDYRLIGGTAASGITLSNFALPTAPTGDTYALSNTVDPGYIDLVVGTAPTGPANLTWDNAGGSGNGTSWDTVNQNWNNGTAATTFSNTSNTSNGDNVTFNDTNNGHYNLAVTSAGVTPNTITVSTTATYNFSGGSIGGGGGLTLTAGTLNVANTTQNAWGSTTVNGGTLVLANNTALPINQTLTIASGASVLASAHTGGASNVTVLQVSTLNNSGTLNLTNNSLAIASGSTVASVTTQLTAAYNGGLWNGTSSTGGVITSTTAAGDTTYLTAIGVATGLTSFDGITVPSTDILVKYTYYGDTNLDGAVDGSDYTNIDNGFNGHLTGWQNGDLNYDGVVDGSDYTLIDNAYNTQGPTLGTNSAELIAGNTAQIAGGTAVPEPTTIGLLGIGGVGLVGRRRRRH